MKKFMVLAVIALASVAMISCGGEKKDEKKAADAAQATVEQVTNVCPNAKCCPTTEQKVQCNKECATCPQAATCPEAKIECNNDCKTCPQAQTCPKAKAECPQACPQACPEAPAVEVPTAEVPVVEVPTL